MKSLGVALFEFYVSYCPVCHSGEDSGFLDTGHTHGVGGWGVGGGGVFAYH